jgi:hypothetical protein
VVRALYVAVVLSATLMNVAQAVPASPYPYQVEQPDGSSFEAIARGDEFQGWIETGTGYTPV